MGHPLHAPTNSHSERVKAVKGAEEPKETTLTEVVEIAAPNAKFQEDKAFDRDGYHVCDHPPNADEDAKELFSDTEVSNSLSDEDNYCVAEEQILDVDDWFDAAEDE